MPELGDLVDDLVVGGEDVVGELYLAHRPEPIQAHPEGNRGYAPLRQGVSKTLWAPCFSCNPSVVRNTPPK